MNVTNRVAKTQLICASVFAYTKFWFSDAVAHSFVFGQFVICRSLMKCDKLMYCLCIVLKQSVEP